MIADVTTIGRDRAWPLDDLDDPFALRPRFWSSTRDELFVSPTIAGLFAAGARRDLDMAALAVFLRIGFFVGDDTPFAAIRAVPPRPRVVWTATGPTIASGWIGPRPSTLNRVQAEQRFADLVDDAVARAARLAVAPIAVTLTGGHDSRHLLLALVETGCSPGVCVTVEPFPPGSHDDVEIARRLAALTGICHVVIPQRTDRVRAEREKNALTDWCTDEHVQFLPLRDHFARVSSCVFDGLGGDVLSQSQRLDDGLQRSFADGRLTDVANQILGDPERVEPALMNLLSAEAASLFPRHIALSRVVREAARHAAMPNPIASFFFFNRTRREIALAPYALLGCPVATPFTDPPMAEFLLSLPYDIVRDRRFHTATLHRRFPGFADVPFSGKAIDRGDRLAVRRDATRLLMAVTRSHSTLLDIRAVAARCLRAIASGASRHLWFLPKVMHMLDVELAAREGATIRTGSASIPPAAA